MMVMQQIALGADFLSILRPYFGQTKQHIADVGLTVGHITATHPMTTHLSTSPMSAAE